MAYGFIGPGHSTPGELKDAVQPSLGTAIGQALGGAAMNFAGAFKQRRDQAQKEASSLRMARQQHANALGLQENAARLRGKTGGLTAHQSWQQERSAGLDKTSALKAETQSKRQKSIDAARVKKSKLEAEKHGYTKEKDTADATARLEENRLDRILTRRGQNISTTKEINKQAQLSITNQQTSNALATQNFERQSKRVVDYYAEIAGTALNEAGVPADDLRFTVNGITQLLLAGRDDKGNINVKEIGPRLRKRLVEAMDVATDWNEHKDKKARSKVIFKMDASLKNKKAFAEFADELKAVSDLTAHVRKKELASDTAETTRDTQSISKWHSAYTRKLNTYAHAENLENDKGFAAAFTDGSGRRLSNRVLAKLYNPEGFSMMATIGVHASKYRGNMAAMKREDPDLYQSLLDAWYPLVLTATNKEVRNPSGVWGMAGLSYIVEGAKQ
jgi:hypothetical protein